jgi:TolA-binding protein
MRRALLVVVVSIVAIALVALKSSAQSTSPRVSAEDEIKVLKQLLSEANVKADRLAGQLSQMQQANQQLEQQIEKKDKEIARLQVRIASTQSPVIPFGDLSLRGNAAIIPPNAQQRQFNGQPYYLIPLTGGGEKMGWGAVKLNQTLTNESKVVEGGYRPGTLDSSKK